ncbi:phospholipase C, phosphocholine-specific [Catenulispora sp. NF23]|uniref:phosphocholine-specific phospholipase C n=1 Tax=Catenulispora pinistramenti TaxID=2705254 RepID=UPI001BA7077E|nr:phospholipase C, phosphocholine-specific [Catenulispora pinistramenti]MBS2535522.1 phospholipase C, phosphocholine-specific [Catenulispora pinistramenti]
MSPLTRRTFLGTAAALGAALGLESLPGAAPRASAAASATGTIADVKHVVVLMQENRSFDHYFGTLQGVRGFDDRATVQLPGGASVFKQPDGSGTQYPWQLSATGGSGSTTPEQLAQCDGSLDHGWASQHSAWDGGAMNGWIAAKNSNRTMGYLSRSDIPFHYALADAYTICDAYHCSILSATGPNRTYLWSGMIDPAGTAGGPAYDGGDESGLSWQTYAEALQNAGVSWKVYQNASDNFGDNALAYFKQFSGADPSSALYQRGMGSVPATTGSTPDDIAAAIKADALAGTLPQVSWVVASQAFSEHPDAPPNDGAHFVNLVIQALAADPTTFDSTVLFLNYDENDGFFDHVPPPAPAAGTTDEFYNGLPIGLGIRVPMIVVSPWTRGGWVDSQVYDHTSVIRFLETWTAALGTPATCPNISAWRRQVCGDLTGAFDFANPVTGLPSLPATDTVIGQGFCNPQPNPGPTTNSMPSQEGGTRPARALPYQPNAWVDHIEYDAGNKILVWLAMANQGPQATSATHFAAYANAYRGGGPWQYTVAPYSNGTDGSTSDYFNVGANYGDGKYDLSVTGANRFMRRFIGDATAAGKTAEATTYYAVASNTGKQAIWFTMTNTGTAAVTFTITANHYRTDGPWTYDVAAGATVTDYFNAVAYANGWYDFTVTVSSDASWSRRAMGHIEVGAASITA